MGFKNNITRFKLNCNKQFFQWRELEKNFIQSHPKCEMCGITKKLQAHHIIPQYIIN